MAGEVTPQLLARRAPADDGALPGCLSWLYHPEELPVYKETNRMQVRNPLAHLPTVNRRHARLAVSAVAVTAATLGGGLVATALPAYADVTTNAYAIGAPSGAVGAVTASPSAVGEGALYELRGHFRSAVSIIRTKQRLSDRNAVHHFGFGPGQH